MDELEISKSDELYSAAKEFGSAWPLAAATAVMYEGAQALRLEEDDLESLFALYLDDGKAYEIGCGARHDLMDFVESDIGMEVEGIDVKRYSSEHLIHQDRVQDFFERYTGRSQFKADLVYSRKFFHESFRDEATNTLLEKPNVRPSGGQIHFSDLKLASYRNPGKIGYGDVIEVDLPENWKAKIYRKEEAPDINI